MWRRDKSKHVLYSLRFVILAIFISLFLITTILIIALRSYVLSDEIDYTSATLQKYVANSVLRELTVGIRPVEIQCKFAANLLQSNVLKNDQTQLVPYTYYLVKTMPLVRGAFWGDEAGNFIYSHKETDGSITSEVIDKTSQTPSHIVIHRDADGNIIDQTNSADMSFDPRTRPWYVSAKKSSGTIWTDIYPFYPNNNLGITAASPVYATGDVLLGVFGADVSLDYLTQFITEQKVTKNGYSFIITAKEDLVAYPFRSPFTDMTTSANQLINVHKISLPLIDKSIDTYKQTQQSPIQLSFEGQTYLVSYEPVPDLAEHGWLIGVVTPRSDFTGFLKRINYLTLGVSLLLLGVGVVLVTKLVARIVKPINTLGLETEKIKRFELDVNLPIDSNIKEVMQMRDAIRSMKHGLRHFQMYIPKTLVQQLIQSGKDIAPGGERKQLVVLFSDIEGFTSIAEKVDPNQLLIQVCEYFEELAHIINEEKGTIDKYIGDAIMVFWGAPLEEAEPWNKAARAALKFQKSLVTMNAEWAKQGKPVFNTRIGIHMGDAIVGNIGSSDRLNYTALGDTINISSRLENINKIYKSRIIVSDVIYQLIKDKFVLRMLDSVVVAGRSKAIHIYELLGDSETHLLFDIDAYNYEFTAGYHAYEQHKWDAAVIHFRRCLEIYPDDKLAGIFIERCQKGKQT